MEACSVEEWLGPSLWKKLGPYLDDELGVEEVDDMRLLDPEHLDTVRKLLLPIPLKKFGIKYAALMDGETADGETAKTATSATKTDYQPKPQTDYQPKPQPKPQPKLVTARLPAAAEERRQKQNRQKQHLLKARQLASIGRWQRLCAALVERAEHHRRHHDQAELEEPEEQEEPQGPHDSHESQEPRPTPALGADVPADAAVTDAADASTSLEVAVASLRKEHPELGIKKIVFRVRELFPKLDVSAKAVKAALAANALRAEQAAESAARGAKNRKRNQRKKEKKRGAAAAAAAIAAAVAQLAKDKTALLLDTPDDVALAIACALGSATDLLALMIACKRYRLKTVPRVQASSRPGDRLKVSNGRIYTQAVSMEEQQMEMWSIAEEAARRWIASCSINERGWVPRRGRECWLGLMWEVQVLRRDVVLSRHHEFIAVTGRGERAHRLPKGGYTWRDVASKVVMRGGRHFLQFIGGHNQFFGVIRPSWDVEGEGSAHRADGHCFYYTYYGHRWPAPIGSDGAKRFVGSEWDGYQDAKEEGDRIGLLLDLDEGTMTVYKNDERLGVMATGLTIGEGWCWSMVLRHPRDTARIVQTNPTRLEACDLVL